MKSILFVCLGNICRSPLAEGIAKKYAKLYNLKLDIDSAGTSSWHASEAPCENSIKVALNHNIDIKKQKSRQVKTEDKNYDFIVAMDKNNYEDLKNLGFENIYLIGNFGGFKGDDVPDPYYYKGFEGFNMVYNMLDICIEDFLKTKGLLK